MRRLIPRSFAVQVLFASVIIGVGSSMAWASAVRPDSTLAGAAFGLIFGLIVGGVAYIAIRAFDRGPGSGPIWAGLRSKDPATRLRR